MKKIIILGLMLLSLCVSVGAATRPAQEIIQDTSARMIDALRKNSTALRQDSSRIYQLVEQIVLPNFDFQLMSRWVLGRAWQQASPEQRRLFADEFRTLLVRTYAKALLEYADQDIRMPPQPSASGDQATVRTEVQPKSGRPIQINYSMNLGQQGWKVYDVTVDGVSLVTSYRSTFASQIRNSGLDAVIADLRQRNAQGGR